MKFCFIVFLGFVLVSTSSNPVFAQTSEDEIFLVAQKAFDDGFYDVAIRYINQFLERYPETEKRVQANLLLGQCYFFKSQYLKAFDTFNNLLSYSEFKDATLFWLGETYLKGADYVQAEKHFQQLIEVYPDSPYTPQSYYSLSWVYFDQGQYTKARDTFLLLSRKFPAHQLTEDASFKLGECEYNLKRYEIAIQYFQDYVTKFPQSTRHDQAYFYIAESHYYQNNFTDAVAYYEKAANIANDDRLILMAKISSGWSHFKAKNFAQAQTSFQAAKDFSETKNMPSDDIYLGLASLASEMEDHAKALEAYDTLIEKFPQSQRLPEAQLGKANMLYALKRYPEAIVTYRHLIDTYEKEVALKEIIQKAFFGLAWTYLKAGNIDLAINHFEKILNQTENNVIKVSALTQIGDAYQDAGRLQEAVEVYDRILKTFPDSLYIDYIQYRQGIALLKMDKIEGAALAFQSLQTNFPKSKYRTDLKYYLGVAYFKKNDWASAREQVEEFLKVTDTSHEFSGQANYILALSLLNLQEAGKAIKAFQKIIKQYQADEALVKNAEIGLAKSFYKLGQTKEAVKRFKIFIYKYPESSSIQEALLWLGDYYLEHSNFKIAIQYYEQLIENFPKSEKIDFARYELGQAMEAQGYFDKALNQYKLIKQDRKDLYAKAQLAIADIFAKELDLHEAIRTYHKIAESSPDFRRDAYLKIAKIYEKNKRLEEAIASYNKALTSDKLLSKLTNAELQFYIADAYEVLNQPETAVEEYLKIPYLYTHEVSWVIKAYLRVARIFEDREDWDNARLTYDKVIQYETPEMKFAQERIQWIENNITEGDKIWESGK